MDKQRIPGFRWAMIIFIFYIISYALPTILKDFQGSLPYKSFVFDLTFIAPFVAVLICLIIFGSKRIQLSGLKFTLGLDTIVRFLLALIIPLVIFIVAMTSFNVFADSFILLQAEDLSVSITTVIVGQLVMAFLIEFAFRSYLQNIVENRVYNLFASIIVGFLYSLWNVNLSFGVTYAVYSFLYGFAFSIIVGELIRGMKGRTIYIATAFHFIMSFGLVFLFNEELGNVFAMKVIALSTVAVGLVYLILSTIVRVILYFFTRRNFDEIEENNYMDHLNDEEEIEDSKRHNATAQEQHFEYNSDEATAVTANPNPTQDNLENTDKAVTDDTIQSDDYSNNEAIATSKTEEASGSEVNNVADSDRPITEDASQDNERPVTQLNQNEEQNDIAITNDETPVTEDETKSHDSELDNDPNQNNSVSNSSHSNSETYDNTTAFDEQQESSNDAHSNLFQNVANDTETTSSSNHSTNVDQTSTDETNEDTAQPSEQSETQHSKTNAHQRTSFLTKLKKRNRR